MVSRCLVFVLLRVLWFLVRMVLSRVCVVVRLGVMLLIVVVGVCSSVCWLCWYCIRCWKVMVVCLGVL